MGKYASSYRFIFILTIVLIITVGCAGKSEVATKNDYNAVQDSAIVLVKNNSNPKNSRPASILENANENPKLTIINLIRSEPYNPNGYRLYRYGEEDKYGNPGIEEDILIVFLTEDQVQEIKKYRDVYIFWDSTFGKDIVNKMISCVQKKQIICNCNKNGVEN